MGKIYKYGKLLIGPHYLDAILKMDYKVIQLYESIDLMCGCTEQPWIILELITVVRKRREHFACPKHGYRFSIVTESAGTCENARDFNELANRI